MSPLRCVLSWLRRRESPSLRPAVAGGIPLLRPRRTKPRSALSRSPPRAADCSPGAAGFSPKSGDHFDDPTARSPSSAATVPPAYYAHLAAFRARYYVEGDSSDGGSTAGSSGQAAVAREGPVEVRQLPKIKKNFKDVMFYC